MSDEGYYRFKLDAIAPLLADKDRRIAQLEATFNENVIYILHLRKRIEELEEMVSKLTGDVPNGSE
jgi:hypothetical protein